MGQARVRKTHIGGSIPPRASNPVPSWNPLFRKVSSIVAKSVVARRDFEVCRVLAKHSQSDYLPESASYSSFKDFFVCV
jgi:hypothetical protein